VAEEASVPHTEAAAVAQHPASGAAAAGGAEEADEALDLETVEIIRGEVEDDGTVVIDDLVLEVDPEGNIVASDERIEIDMPDGTVIVDETFSVAGPDGELEEIEEDTTIYTPGDAPAASTGAADPT